MRGFFVAFLSVSQAKMPKRNDYAVTELNKNPSYREIFEEKSTIIGRILQNLSLNEGFLIVIPLQILLYGIKRNILHPALVNIGFHAAQQTFKVQVFEIFVNKNHTFLGEYEIKNHIFIGEYE